MNLTEVGAGITGLSGLAGPYAPIAAITGTTLSTIGAMTQAEKERKRLELERKLLEQRMFNINAYNKAVQSVPGGNNNQMFALGGVADAPYLTAPGTVPIGGGAQEIVGAGTHESGMDVPVTSPNGPVAMAEQGEVLDGNAVFSKRLGFADAVKPLIARRTELETLISKTDDPYKKGTYERQLQSVNQQIDGLLAEQQQMNGDQTGGAGLPEAALGIIDDPLSLIKTKYPKRQTVSINPNIRDIPGDIANSIIRKTVVNDASNSSNTSDVPPAGSSITSPDFTKIAPYLDIAANTLITSKRPMLETPTLMTPGTVVPKVNMDPVIGKAINDEMSAIAEINSTVADPQVRSRMIAEVKARTNNTLSQVSGEKLNRLTEAGNINANSVTQASAANANTVNQFNLATNALQQENLNDLSAIISNTAGKIARAGQQQSALQIIMTANPEVLSSMDHISNILTSYASTPAERQAIWNQAKGKAYQAGIKQVLSQKFPNEKFE